MIKLFAFGPHFGVPDPSSFVLKLDAYMRMAGIEFETDASLRHLQRAPKGKLPFIEDDGQLIADTHFIIQHLERTRDVQLDAWLTPKQLGTARLLGKAFDEHLYWCLLDSRWMRGTWPVLEKAFFGRLPFPLKAVVPRLARGDVKTALHRQGLGRHSYEEILSITRYTLEGAAGALDDQAYFMGEQPCSLDAAAFGALAQVILPTLDDDPVVQMARSFDNLVAYCARMRDRYYPEMARTGISPETSEVPV
jgi:glutathione S-transferase